MVLLGFGVLKALGLSKSMEVFVDDATDLHGERITVSESTDAWKTSSLMGWIASLLSTK
jgi:hypothetical protein